MAKRGETATIKRLNEKTASFILMGTTVYVQNKFSSKARQQLHDAHAAGSTAKSKNKKEVKDFQAMYEASIHRDEDGRTGIPVIALRRAIIRACKLAGYVMADAKVGIFVEPDGFDPDDFQSLFHFTKGEPEYFESMVRVGQNKPDIHPRGLWRPGWEAVARIRFDGDAYTLNDIGNLLYRAGKQVGIGEGRPDSRFSAGMGWGLFDIKNPPEGENDEG